MESSLVDGVTIYYRTQKGKYDRKHLTVIFSGFRKKGTFDFQGSALANSTSNILWIDDNFEGKYSYYMRHRGGDDLSEIIYRFICNKLNELNLTIEQCTLAGFSKGGSAALYYLSKYGFKNAVVAVPQFFVGRYISGTGKECIESMTKNGAQEELDELDKILPRVIKEASVEKNLYLFTSPEDPQYLTEIVPNLGLLDRFDNFNMVISESALVTKHNHVTKYNVPGIVSILALLAERITPRFGVIHNGAGAPEKAKSNANSLGSFSAEISNLYVERGRLFLTGYSVYTEYVSDRWGSQKNFLRLKGQRDSLEISLGQISDESVNGKFYTEPFVDHSHASFATIRHKGIDITSLPFGKFELQIGAVALGRSESSNKLSRKLLDSISIHEEKIYRIRSSNSIVSLIVDGFDADLSSAEYFEPIQCDIRDGRLFIKGYLVPYAENIDDWKAIRYFVHLQDELSQNEAYLPIACDNRNDIGEKTKNYRVDRSKAFYATHRYAGVDISNFDFAPFYYRVVGVTMNQTFASPMLSI